MTINLFKKIPLWKHSYDGNFLILCNNPKFLWNSLEKLLALEGKFDFVGGRFFKNKNESWKFNIKLILKFKIFTFISDSQVFRMI